MFCYKCGCELLEKAKFCHKCGNKIDLFQSQEQQRFLNLNMYKEKTFLLGKNKIVFKDGMCEYIEVRAPFEKQASDNKVIFMEWYDKTIKNLKKRIFLEKSCSNF